MPGFSLTCKRQANVPYRVVRFFQNGIIAPFSVPVFVFEYSCRMESFRPDEISRQGMFQAGMFVPGLFRPACPYNG